MMIDDVYYWWSWWWWWSGIVLLVCFLFPNVTTLQETNPKLSSAPGHVTRHTILEIAVWLPASFDVQESNRKSGCNLGVLPGCVQECASKGPVVGSVAESQMKGQICSRSANRNCLWNSKLVKGWPVNFWQRWWRTDGRTDRRIEICFSKAQNHRLTTR